MVDATEDYSKIADSAGSRWLVGVAGAVVDGDRVILIRYSHGDRKGLWSLPGGYARQTERLDQAVVREIVEETGVTAEVVDVIALRTRCTPQGGGVFVLFRLKPLAGESKPDGAEVDRAEYFSADQILALGDDEILAIARNAGLAALSERRGLTPDERAPGSGATYRAFLML
jgi:ADP-ribose pyrophosphatase YjhB (NUDIX family)